MRGKTVGVVGSSSSGTELEVLQAAFAKQYGNRTVVTASDLRQPVRLPTGNFALDLAFCGGLPEGRIGMFLGKRSAGKTTQALKTLAIQQRIRPYQKHAFIDAEHAFDPVWAEKLGVDPRQLIVVRPSSGEEAVDIVEALMRTLEIGLICLDSVAALVPMREIDTSAEDELRVGMHAKLCTTLVRKTNQALAHEEKRDHRPTLLLLNQYRSAIGKHQSYGEPLSIPGGKALEHFTTVQAIFRNKENMGKDEFGAEVLDFNEHQFRVDKNKINGGVRTGEYSLLRQAGDYGLQEGDIEDATTMLAMAKKFGMYTGGGSRWRLQVGPLDETYGKLDEALSDLYSDRNKYWSLRNELMAQHARNLGMPQYHIDSILETESPWKDDAPALSLQDDEPEEAPRPAPRAARAAPRPAASSAAAPVRRRSPVSQEAARRR